MAIPAALLPLLPFLGAEFAPAQHIRSALFYDCMAQTATSIQEETGKFTGEQLNIEQEHVPCCLSA